VALLLAPLVTVITRVLGIRWTMIIGVLIHACGFVAASFASKILHLYWTQGVMVGVGISFMVGPGTACINEIAGLPYGPKVYTLGCSAPSVVQEETYAGTRLFKRRLWGRGYHFQSRDACDDSRVSVCWPLMPCLSR